MSEVCIQAFCFYTGNVFVEMFIAAARVKFSTSFGSCGETKVYLQILLDVSVTCRPSASVI